MARLDRLLITEEWDSHFGGSRQKTLPRPTSDHFPISLEGGKSLTRGPSPFRFENMWLKEKGFKDLIRVWWQSFTFRGTNSYVLMEKTKALKENLNVWNKEAFGMVETNKKVALIKVSHWDNVDSQRPLCTIELEEVLIALEEFKKWSLMEETSWRQKSREIWLKEGDRNTGFF